MDRGEGGIGCVAGLSEQDVVGGPSGGEGRLGLDHVAEKCDRVVNGRDGGVGLEHRVVEAKIERKFGVGGDNGVEELLGIGKVWGFERGRRERGKLGWGCFLGGFLRRVMGFCRNDSRLHLLQHSCDCRTQ